MKIKIDFTLKLLSLVLLMASASSMSQNLVVNPGFEMVNQSSLQCNPYSTLTFPPAIVGWFPGSPGTPDILSTMLPAVNTCACYPLTANPMFFGPQAPRTGNVMLGANMYQIVQNGSNLPSANVTCPGREYIQGTLSTPLVAGTAYNISFYVSLSDNCMIACNNIGVKFSNSLVPVAGNPCILATPEVNYSGAPLTDKTGWTKLEFCYTPAASGQQYFTIGNFLTNAATSTVTAQVTTQPPPGLSWGPGIAYYFFDDVSIVPAAVLATAPDTVICSGSAAVPSVSGTASYSWSPSASLSSATGNTVTAMPSVTTTYTVRETGSVCPAAGRVTVSVTPTPSLQVTASPASICEGDVTSLSASGVGSYTWSTGNTTSSITVSPQSTSIYSVSGANGSCAASATVEVVVMPTIALQVNTVAPVCYGQSIVLAATGGTHYSWLPPTGITNPLSSTVSVQPTSTTIYSVTANSTGACPETKTISVTVYPVPDIDAGADVMTDMDEPVTLNGISNGEMTFFSMSGETLTAIPGNSITVNPSETTCYLLRAVNGYGCKNEDTVCVDMTENYGMYLPNTFTPDADGINDFFVPVSFGFRELRLMIFNRWGAQIYNGNENSPGWDGSHKGTPCAEGIYIYKVGAKTLTGKTITRTGHVALLTKAAR